MSRAGAGWCFKWCFCGEEAGSGVDAKDADEVGAKIRYYNIGIRWVDESFVRMGCVLTAWVGSWSRKCEREALESFDAS